MTKWGERNKTTVMVQKRNTRLKCILCICFLEQCYVEISCHSSLDDHWVHFWMTHQLHGLCLALPWGELISFHSLVLSFLVFPVTVPCLVLPWGELISFHSLVLSFLVFPCHSALSCVALGRTHIFPFFGVVFLGLPLSQCPVLRCLGENSYLSILWCWSSPVTVPCLVLPWGELFLGLPLSQCPVLCCLGENSYLSILWCCLSWSSPVTVPCLVLPWGELISFHSLVLSFLVFPCHSALSCVALGRTHIFPFFGVVFLGLPLSQCPVLCCLGENSYLSILWCCLSWSSPVTVPCLVLPWGELISFHSLVLSFLVFPCHSALSCVALGRTHIFPFFGVVFLGLPLSQCPVLCCLGENSYLSILWCCLSWSSPVTVPCLVLPWGELISFHSLVLSFLVFPCHSALSCVALGRTHIFPFFGVVFLGLPLSQCPVLRCLGENSYLSILWCCLSWSSPVTVPCLVLPWGELISFHSLVLSFLVFPCHSALSCVALGRTHIFPFFGVVFLGLPLSQCPVLCCLGENSYLSILWCCLSWSSPVTVPCLVLPWGELISFHSLVLSFLVFPCHSALSCVALGRTHIFPFFGVVFLGLPLSQCPVLCCLGENSYLSILWCCLSWSSPVTVPCLVLPWGELISFHSLVLSFLVFPCHSALSCVALGRTHIFPFFGVVFLGLPLSQCPVLCCLGENSYLSILWCCLSWSSPVTVPCLVLPWGELISFHSLVLSFLVFPCHSALSCVALGRTHIFPFFGVVFLGLPLSQCPVLCCLGENSYLSILWCCLSWSSPVTVPCLVLPWGELISFHSLVLSFLVFPCHSALSCVALGRTRIFPFFGVVFLGLPLSQCPVLCCLGENSYLSILWCCLSWSSPVTVPCLVLPWGELISFHSLVLSFLVFPCHSALYNSLVLITFSTICWGLP